MKVCNIPQWLSSLFVVVIILFSLFAIVKAYKYSKSQEETRIQISKDLDESIRILTEANNILSKEIKRIKEIK